MASETLVSRKEDDGCNVLVADTFDYEPEIIRVNLIIRIVY